MQETPEIPAQNDEAAPVSQTGMMAGDAFKPPADKLVDTIEDPHEHQRAMADALRAKPKPIEEPSPC